MTAPSALWAKSPPPCPSLRWCCFCVTLNSVHTNFNYRYLLQRLLFPLPFQNNGERKYQYKKKNLYDERPVKLDMQINTKYTLCIQKHFVKYHFFLYYIFPALKGIIKNNFHATDLHLPENCKLILLCNPFLTCISLFNWKSNKKIWYF